MKPEIASSIRHLSRRDFARLLGAAGAGSLLTPWVGRAATGPREVGETLVRYPEKTELILLTDRPPQLETPLRYFREDLTPNEAFFVRWHLAGIPTSVDLAEFRLRVGGHVEHPLALSVAELRRDFEPVSIVAVNQCAGNSRRFFEPRVAGSQWANGAMGNARWTGVRLRDLLNRAGLKAGAADVAFSGLDRPTVASTPAYVKSLAVDRARQEEVLVAYEMNGAELPMLNGFPLRLVVPGWYATYWTKALTDVRVLPAKMQGFWMEKGYRIPTAAGGCETADHLATETTPIHRMNVRSLFVRPEPGERLSARESFEIQGIAFDGGSGIREVEVSVDGGAHWTAAKLDADLGRYSWRRWRFAWTPPAAGRYQLQVRAVSQDGEQQSTTHWNRSGYMRNVIEHTEVEVA